MSTIQKVNFEPVSDMLKVQIRDFGLADKTLANPLNSNAFVDGEWFAIDSSLHAVRSVAINATNNVATVGGFPIFADKGRSDVQANSANKVPLVWLGDWEFDTRIFDASSTAGGAAITTVLQPLTIASISIGGKIVSGLVGRTGSNPIVARVTRLPANNGGKLRIIKASSI